jgi:hypothetical protein
MLFEIALNAIKDSYRREAVTSFSASIERFFEFAVRVIANNKKLAPQVFDGAWKKVSGQSERQFGAYVLLYTTSFAEVPEVLNDNMTKLRNGVVHGGRIPDKAEAIAFGRAAYRVIQAGIQKLRRACLGDVNEVLSQHVSKIANKMGEKYPRTFQVTSTALNVIDDISTGYKTFEQVLAERGI